MSADELSLLDQRVWAALVVENEGTEARRVEVVRRRAVVAGMKWGHQ